MKYRVYAVKFPFRGLMSWDEAYKLRSELALEGIKARIVPVGEGVKAG